MDPQVLLDVAARIRACGGCALAGTRSHAVPGEGGGVFGHAAAQLEDFAAGRAAEDAARGKRPGADGHSRLPAVSAAGGIPAAFSGVMLVGEAPGRNEDESGRPFCGAAGRNLDLGLAAAGLERAEVFVTSIVKCRPPGNRDPTPQEKLACRPFLSQQVEALEPRLIVALGRHGLSGLVDEAPKQFTDVRGTFVDGPRGPDGRPIPVFCSLHPAAIIYRHQWKEAYLDDWRRLGRWLREGVLEAPARLV